MNASIAKTGKCVADLSEAKKSCTASLLKMSGVNSLLKGGPDSCNSVRFPGLPE
jgi:hypothetical protein